MRHELSADEGYEQKRSGKNDRSYEHGCLGVVETPLEFSSVFVADPFKRPVRTLAHTTFEPIGAHDRNERERQDQCTDECDRYCIGHWSEEFSRRPGERVDGQV